MIKKQLVLSTVLLILPCMVCRVHAQGPAVAATARPEIHGGFITSADILCGGWGYFEPPAVAVQDVAGSNAVITAQIGGGAVTNLLITDPGRNYSPATTIRIRPPQSKLQFSRLAPDLVLTWLDASALQSATNVSGPYADVQSATSPHTNNPGNAPARYFRLRNRLFEGNPPPPTSGGNRTNCSLSLPNPVLSVSVSNGVTVDWYDAPAGGNRLAAGTTNFSPTNTFAGTYAYHAEARISGTSVVSTNRAIVTLTLNPRPKAAVSGSATICNGGATPVQAVLTGIGPWNVTWSSNGVVVATHPNVVSSPDTLIVAPGNPNLNAAAAHLYTVSALSDANCTAGPGDLAGSAVITVNPRPTSTLLALNATNCNDGTAYMLTNLLTGIGPWQITWSDGVVQNTMNRTATRSVWPSATQTYTVTNLTDANCIAQAGDRVGSATVTVYPLPLAPTSLGNQTNCAGVLPNPSLSVSVPAGVAVDWYATLAGGSPIAVNTPAYVPTNTAAGTYGYYAQSRALATACVSTDRTLVTLTLLACPPL